MTSDSTEGRTTVTTDLADKLMHDLMFIDCIDAGWLGDTIKATRLLEPRSLGRLGRIISALDEIREEANAKDLAEIAEHAASSRGHIAKRIPFRIGLDLISKDPFERDLAFFRYEIGRWVEETGFDDEQKITSLASGYGLEVRDLVMTPVGAPTPCFIGHATFARDGVERAIDIPPVVISWTDETDAPPPAPPFSNVSGADIAPDDLPF